MNFSFLMCSERSGSNLITRMLDAHPQVCGPAPKHLINPVARNLYRYEPLDRPENWQALLHDVQALLAADFSRWRLGFSVDDLAALAPPGDAVTLIRRIYEREAASHGKTQLFIKENHVYEFIAFLLLNFPQATYVYQVRDPRDMALSWKRNPSHPGGVCRAARQWQSDQQNCQKLYAELRRRGQAVRLRYEDLIADPQAALTPVLDLLGLPYAASMLDFHQAELTRANAGQQAAWANLDKALMRDNQQKWRSGLSAEEIRAVESICFHEMQHLGYGSAHGAAELERYAADGLAAFEAADGRAKAQVQPAGVKANVEAKTRFYRHLPPSAAARAPLPLPQPLPA